MVLEKLRYNDQKPKTTRECQAKHKQNQTVTCTKEGSKEDFRKQSTIKNMMYVLKKLIK